MAGSKQRSKFKGADRSCGKASSQKGKPNYKKNKSKAMPQTSEETGGYTNDVKWYSNHPDLLNSVSHFLFDWPIGNLIAERTQGKLVEETEWFTQDSRYTNVPGVLGIWLKPSLGYSNDTTSALNLAATQLYTFVRHLNSGSANYDPNDLMLYIPAMASVYAMINFCERLYGTAQLYTQLNKYYPEAVFAAQYIDYNSVAMNLADFRYRLNLLIAKASSFAVPASIDYFKRQAFNFAGLYTEGDSIKDQTYLFIPHGVYVFGKDADGAGMLKMTRTPMAVPLDEGGDLVTANQLFDFIDNMINLLLAEEDFGIMNGDVLKAYGKDGILTLSFMPDNYTVFPVYDSNVLEQIRNSNEVWPGYNPNQDYEFGNVVQSPNKDYLIVQNHVNISGLSRQQLLSYRNAYLHATGSTTINCKNENPPEGFIVESTRLVTKVQNYTETKNGSTYGVSYSIYSGADMVVAVEMINLSAGKPVRHRINNSYAALDLGNPSTNYHLFVKGVAEMRSFQFYPQVWLALYNSTASQVSCDAYPLINYDNYAVLQLDDVVRLHEVCMLSLLHVNTIAQIK